MGFGGLSIATSGIRAAQVNLAVTGHNLSNAEIAGFSRQRVVQTTGFTRQVGVPRSGIPMVKGMGTDWNAVEQIRNEFLDFHYRQSNGRLQFYSAMVQTGLVIESALGELYGAYNFQTTINNMWNAIQELTANPSDIATRQMLLARSNEFLVKAQTVHRTLFEYQKNLDMQIRDLVNGRDGINNTVAQINHLNMLIRNAEASGDNANDFRDERNRAVDRLSGMIPISVHICPMGDVNIITQGHELLVQGYQSIMGLRYISDHVNFVEPVFAGTPQGVILSAGTPPSEFSSFINYSRPIDDVQGNDFGQLKALMLSRGNGPAHRGSAETPRPIRPQQTEINPGTGLPLTDAEYARAIREYEASVHNWNAYMWGVNHAMIPEAQMNLDRIVTQLITMLNDSVTGNLRGTDGQFLFYQTNAAGDPIYQYDAGDPVFIHRITGQRMMPADFTATPELQRYFDDNSVHARVNRYPLDLNGRRGIPMFIRTVDDPETATWPIPSVDPHNPGTWFSITNMRLNPDLLDPGGHNYLAFSMSGGVDDTDLLNQLQRVWMAGTGPYATRIGNRTFNVQDAYINMTGNLSTRINYANVEVAAETVMVIQKDNRRNAIKGVSMDEELNAMLRFQFAFQGSSRVLNVLDSMIDQVVNRTGRSGL